MAYEQKSQYQRKKLITEKNENLIVQDIAHLIETVETVDEASTVTPFIYYNGAPLGGTYRITTTLVGGKYTYEDVSVGGARMLKFNSVDNRWEFYENDVATHYASSGARPAFTIWYDISTDEPILVKFLSDPATNVQESNELLAQSITTLKSLTKTVNISSAQILAMGTTPIELLAAPGANMYYDIEKIILEYIFVSVDYTVTAPYIQIDNPTYFVAPYFLTSSENASLLIHPHAEAIDAVNGVSFFGSQVVGNRPLTIGTWDDSNPTLGDGTLRAIITYTVRTFGA